MFALMRCHPIAIQLPSNCVGYFNPAIFVGPNTIESSENQLIHTQGDEAAGKRCWRWLLPKKSHRGDSKGMASKSKDITNPLLPMFEQEPFQ